MLRVATYNFLHGGSSRRSAHWNEVLSDIQPDILLCQESRPPSDSELKNAGGSFSWQAAPGVKWGSGIWIRGGRVEPRPVLGYEGWVTALALPDADAIMFSVHCPAGPRGYIDSMHRILDAMIGVAGHAAVLLAGDLNVACGYRDNGDVVKMSHAERALLDRIRDDLGLHSCWQAANPGIPLAQTLRWMRNTSTPYHCDGIFVPKSWLPALISCKTVSGAKWDALSDHNPVVADFRTN